MGNIKENLKARIKRLRTDAGLSQVALANLAGISVQTIKDVEAGRRGLGLRALEGISSALKVSIDDLKGETEPVIQKVSHIKASKALKMFESIPDEIYDLAVNIGPDHEIWKVVRSVLETASEGVGKKTKEQSPS